MNRDVLRNRAPVFVGAAVVGAVAVLPLEAAFARRGPQVEDIPPPRAPMVFGAGHGSILDLVLLGDSAASGVGGPYEEGVAMSVTRHLARTRPVRLVNLAVSGARTADVVSEQLPAAVERRPEVVLVSVGANDVMNRTPLRDLREGIQAIVSDLRAARPGSTVVCTGSPPVWTVPRIPQPLRAVAGIRCRVVNRVIEEATEAAGGDFLAMADICGPAFAADRAMFCEDGYHPSPMGYAHASAVLCGFLDGILSSRDVTSG